MTITFKYESRTDRYKDRLWCEQYADKHSDFTNFWRWGINDSIQGDFLLYKPNMNRLMKSYLASGEIEVETMSVDSVHKAFTGESKRKRYTIQNIKESLKTQPMRKINEDRIVPDVEWNEDDEWDDNYNISYIFQLSRMVMFEVDYYRLGGNKQPHFGTSAQVFCRNKRDITRGGQCQADVLKDFPAAYEFWKKWDKKHLHRLDYKTYQELLDDIEFLKEEYNWDYTKSGNGFPFWREVELSKQKPKKRFPLKRVDEGFIDDIKNKFGKKLEKQTKKDIEYTPDNNKGVYSVDDILMLISKRFQNKFEQFLIEASRWGKARNNNYREKQEGDLCPVAYDRGKFYTKTNLDGWTLVPFNYRQLSF